MNIKYLQHHEIDFNKWDRAIYNAVNGLVYSTSWYLNIINPNWTALVAGDYEVVMPLTFKSKYGIRYLYKPFFCQFLGVFYQKENDKVYVQNFIEEAIKYFKYINININVSNSFFKAEYARNRKTQVLPLNGDYEKLSGNYNRSTRNNIKKANKEDIQIESATDPKELILLIKQMYANRNVVGVKRKDFQDLEGIMNYAIQNSLGKVYHVMHNNKICAAAFFLKWKDRIISLQTANNDIGREKRALFRLLDFIIKENANSELLLDFAGSNIPGVANWNLGFGAIEQHYYTIVMNKLPKLVRWFKK